MNVQTDFAPCAALRRSGRLRKRVGPAWTGVLLGVAFIAMQLLAGTSEAQIVSEFSAGIPPAPANRGITLGPDGNVWFTEEIGNRIGRITPAGVVTEFSAGLSAGANPGSIVTGPDNNIWFLERNGNRVGKIIALPGNGVVGTITEYSAGITPGAQLSSICVGPDGNLWFVEFLTNKVGKITTAGVVTEFSAGITPGAGLASIVAGSDGNLWFTENTISRMGRITTAGVVTEFSAGISPGSGPNGITLGPDGNVWFTELAGNRIGFITPAGAVTEFSAGISPGSNPRNITSGPDGNLWFVEQLGNRVARITTAGVVTQYANGISPGAQPWSITTGSDGNLWFTEYSGNQIGQIIALPGNGTVGSITEFNAGISQGAQPYGIAQGPDGNLWFAQDSAIGKITPGGVVTQFTAGISPGARPAVITAGPDGNLWFTEYLGNRIGRITPAGVVTEFSAGISPGGQLLGIVAGPDGNIWFTENVANRIGRIVALPQNGIVGTVTEFSAGISPDADLGTIAAGPDGNLWFIETIGRIGRITPAGVVMEFSAGISPGASPNDIVAGADGNMWFTEYDGNRIGRIVALPGNGTVGTVTEFSAGIAANSTPNGIAAGPDGNLWFTQDAGNRIGRITPAGVVTNYGQGMSLGAGPALITAGPDGNMWFAEFQGSRIGRLRMPSSNYVVTNTTDAAAGSLREAIFRANADPGSNTVTFDPSVTGTITLTSGQIQISGPLTITGPGSASLAVNANAAGRIFSIFATDPACPAIDGADYLVTISGLHLTNARRTQTNAGGAIFSEHSLVLDAMLFDNNVAPQGGGVFVQAQYAGQVLTINNSQFMNNVAQPIGSSPANSYGGALTVFERCAGVHVAPNVNITSSVFSGNQSLPVTLNGQGGAIILDTIGSATITDTRIVNNQVVTPNPPVATQSYRSGGLQVHMKTLLIERSEFSDNSLVDPTGADLTRGGAMVAFNTAADLQGPADTMSVKIVNSTISGNASPSTAGAMLISGNVAVEFDNSTVSNNLAAPTRTGGIALAVAAGQLAPTLTTTSSIFAKNAGDGGDVAAAVATFPTFTITSNNSLFEKICPSPGCEISLSGAGNLIGVDPALAPLSFNGGPTRTQALILGSPAINAGSNPLALTTDQRGAGFPRVLLGTTDMGAYEGSITALPPVLVSAQSRKTHGTAGTFDLLLNANPLTPSTETRNGPAYGIVFTFDKPVTAGVASVTESAAVAGAPTFNGSEMTVPLTGVANPQYVTLNVTNVVASDGGSGGTGSARIGFLFGDANQSRQVTVADVGIVNAALLQPLNNVNFLYDVNVDGKLTVADKGLVNANLLKKLPAP